MKKILHIANTDRFSGAENVICQIISMFRDDEGIEMAYVSRDGQIREALEERSIRFIPVESVSVAELKRVIKEERPDVVHAHDMKASLMAALACGKTRLVCHLHNNDYANRKLSAKSIAFLLPCIKASHLFFVSDSSYEGYIFHNWFKRKSSVLFNIIDIDAIYDKANRDEQTYDYDAVYVGRLTYQKNPQRLLAVMKKATDRLPDIKMVIVGTGEMDEEIADLRKELKLERNVDLLGFKSNPTKIMKEAKVMMMTSRWEGTPMCALESFALGTPIVSTPTDGLMELIRNGETGFLSDDDDELADRIVQIVADDELRTRMSMNCIEDARRRNDIDMYKNKLKKAYNG